MGAGKNSFSKNPEFVMKLFDSISNNYDKLNDIMTFGLHRKIKKDIIKNLSVTQKVKVLDLCCGTGDMVFLLKKMYPQAEITGVDFSKNMLKIAKEKCKILDKTEFLEADCTQLPFKNESFDVCIISFGLRNMENMEKALSEIFRILKKDGIFINLDLGKPNKILNIFLKPYMYIWIALLGKIFHGNETPYKYLAVSNESFPNQEKLVEMFKQIGFLEVKNTNYLFGQIASQMCKK